MLRLRIVIILCFGWIHTRIKELGPNIMNAVPRGDLTISVADGSDNHQWARNLT